MYRDRKATDLEWLAFRYVAGALDAPAARGFEDRLAEDQEAREAVGRAVALGLRVAAARPEDAGGGTALRYRRGRRWVRALAWSAAGIAAGLMLLAYAGPAPIGMGRNLPWVGPAPDSQPAQPETGPNVEAWVELRWLGDAATQLEQQLGERGSDDLASRESEAGLGPVLPAWVAELARTNE